MPDITYSWFYVFSKKLLSDNNIKPVFENAILYGFSNSIFNIKYKELQVSLDKASFYHYNAHNIFNQGGCIIPIVDKNRTKAKNNQLTKIIADSLLLEKILDRYKQTINKLQDK